MSRPFIFAGSHTAKDIYAVADPNENYLPGRFDLNDTLAVAMEHQKTKELQLLLEADPTFCPKHSTSTFYRCVAESLEFLNGLHDSSPDELEQRLNALDIRDTTPTTAIQISQDVPSDTQDVYRRILESPTPRHLEGLLVFLNNDYQKLEREISHHTQSLNGWLAQFDRFLLEAMKEAKEEMKEDLRPFIDLAMARLEEMMKAHVRPKIETDFERNLRVHEGRMVFEAVLKVNRERYERVSRDFREKLERGEMDEDGRDAEMGEG